MIKVLRYKLDRARRQSFYIIDTPSRKLPQPIIHITGSYGNLYQITFTPTGISCSCDDSSTPCKHILYVLAVNTSTVTFNYGLDQNCPCSSYHFNPVEYPKSASTWSTFFVIILARHISQLLRLQITNTNHIKLPCVHPLFLVLPYILLTTKRQHHVY